jgi:O-antigen/teichoic acid export membrane protein
VLCHQVLLIRVLDFRNHGMMETLGKCAYMGCAIWLARHGHGAWSLAWGQFAEGLAVLVLVLILVPRRVALRMNLPRLLGLLRYGCSMTGGVVATQWRDGVSSALVGGVSGPTPLGFFQKAVGSSTLAIRHLVWSITDVLFPWMAGLVPDSTETREKVAKVVRMVTLLTWPACVGMAVVADLFIVGIYGSRWSGAVGLLRILCFPAMLFAVQHQLITMLWALGKAGQVMRVNLAAMLISWTGVWIGLHVSGVFGATVGLALAATVQFLLLSGCLLSAVKMGAGTYIQALLPSGVMAAAMGLVVVAFRSWCLPPEHAVLSRLFTSVCVGVAVYALLVFIWRPAAVSDFARTVHMHLGDERTRRIPYLSSILRHLEAER